MWETHMLGLTRRGMETGSESTAPFLDPTDEAGTGNGLRGYRASSRPYLVRAPVEKSAGATLLVQNTHDIRKLT